MDGRDHHRRRSDDEPKSKHYHHKSREERKVSTSAKPSKGRRNADSSSPSPETKRSRSHSQQRRETVEEKSRRSSEHAKSRAAQSRDETETVADRKPSYIPSATETSPRDKFNRIERWRQDGARCLLEKQQAEAALRNMSSRLHGERRKVPEKIERSRVVNFEKRRHHSHHGRVESTEPSRVPSSDEVKLEEAARQKVAKFMAKSLHDNLLALNSSRKATFETVEMKSAESDESVTPSHSASRSRAVELSARAPDIPARQQKPSSLKSGLANSKSRDTAASYSKTILTLPSTLSEPKKLELQWDYSTLKIMNLPLSLTLNDLKSLFPQSTSVTLPMKQFDADGSEMSLGQTAGNPTAYVKFSSTEDAAEVMDHFQGLKIRGHALKISIDYQHRLE